MSEPLTHTTVSANVWISKPNVLVFPETELASIRARPPAALCFSGGGSRAMSASLGYYRGLLAAGFLERVRYISCVSGGSWASSIFTYYREGPSDDAALLDIGLPAGAPPAELSLARLASPLPPKSMASVITGNLLKDLLEDLLEGGREDAWNRAVAKTYLEPFGLVDGAGPLTPCLDAATRDAILARPDNRDIAGLGPDNFILPRADRPFIVINACIVEPADHSLLAPQNPISLQFTPLYVGSPQPLEIRYERSVIEHETWPMGGGFVEPFAFGGAGPQAVELGKLACVPLEPLAIEGRQTLEFAVGSSSAAYAAVADAVPGLDDIQQVTPVAPYWPVREGAIAPAQSFDIADGGVLENYGLLAMLQRGIERAVVFINTDTDLDLDYEPFTDGEPSDASGKVDVYLPNLFGVELRSTGTDQQNNTVFTHAAYAELIRALQARKRAGEPLVVKQRLAVQANAWWGIREGWSVEVAWVYLARVPKWEEQLPDDTRAAIVKGNREHFADGPLCHFPYYNTIEENHFTLVELTPTQIRAEAALCEWVIGDVRGTIEQVLSS